MEAADLTESILKEILRKHENIYWIFVNVKLCYESLYFVFAFYSKSIYL